MKRFVFLTMCFFLAAADANSQDFLIRRPNTVGNWKAYVANDGSMFHLFDTLPGSPGGRWFGLGAGRDLIYGAGLWIGGFRNGSPSVSYSYGPGSGSSSFVPGSIVYGGLARDTSESGRERYRVYRSTDPSLDEWPLRLLGDGAHYIDDPAARMAMGPPRILGDEDLFTIYKDSDPILVESPEHRPLGLEVRTTSSFWGQGLGADVIVVQNEILYSGDDTVKNPYISIVADGDVDDPYDDRLRGVLSEGIRSALFYTDGAAPGSPILGFILLKGYTRRGLAEHGVHAFRYWPGQSEDPISDSAKYAFMTEQRFDTATTVVGDPRLLLTSRGEPFMLTGDTIEFDYAIFAFTSAGAGFNAEDESRALEIGVRIRTLYQQGRLGELAVRSKYAEQASISGHVYSHSGVIPIAGNYRITDVLGRTIRTGRGPIDTSGLPNGWLTVVGEQGPFRVLIL